jgi:hypothetical protein
MPDTAFDLKSDSPVNDDLMFWSIVRHESLSRPSFYELTVLSRSRLIDPKDILGMSFNFGGLPYSCLQWKPRAATLEMRPEKHKFAQ